MRMLELRTGETMSHRLRAIYKNGAFVPLSNGEKLNVSENAEVEITVHDPSGLPLTAARSQERERALHELFASWDEHPLRADAPRLTRDEMHERR